jgi:dolichyl-phosphate beta-glucosyltransferase
MISPKIKTKVSIVIPCYNEEKNLKRGVLNEVYRFLKTQDFGWEVLVANDGSTDQSAVLADQFCQKHSGFRLLDLPHGGKPKAVWGGIQKAKFPLVLFTDMDQSTPLKEITKLLPYFKDYDLAIGSRGIKRRGAPWYRQLGGLAFRHLRGLFLLRNIEDTQCGFKMFKTSVAKKCFPHLAAIKDTTPGNEGWRVGAFDVELLFIAQNFGFKIKEVRVNWRDEDESDTKGQKQGRFLRESIDMAQEIFRVKLNQLKGLYNES